MSVRLAKKIGWALARILTKLPQTASVTWWTAALLRFASTGETLRVVKQ